MDQSAPSHTIGSAKVDLAVSEESLAKIRDDIARAVVEGRQKAEAELAAAVRQEQSAARVAPAEDAGDRSEPVRRPPSAELPDRPRAETPPAASLPSRQPPDPRTLDTLVNTAEIVRKMDEISSLLQQIAANLEAQTGA